MDLTLLTSISQMLANINELSVTILDPIDAGRVFNGEESKMAGVLSETSETRSFDDEDTESGTCGATKSGDGENSSSGTGEDSVTMIWDPGVGTNDSVDEDSGCGASKVDVELNEFEAKSARGTKADTTEEGDSAIDGDSSWDVSETMGRGAADIVDEDEELRG